ncbi:hypothetical protein HN51_049401 [Arachis hypogaea]
MMTSLKTYISFVFLFAFVLSSHVLTHELFHEEMNDEESDPLKDLTSDSSVGYKPNGQWGITIGPEPNDEFDDEDFSSGEYNSGRRYRNYGGGGGSERYNNYPRGGRRGGSDYDDGSDDDDDYNRHQSDYNRRRYRRYSVESVHPQSLTLQNSEMMMKKYYDLDGNKIKHRKTIRPSKFDYGSSTTDEDGVKKGYEEVGKKPVN